MDTFGQNSQYQNIDGSVDSEGQIYKVLMGINTILGTRLEAVFHCNKELLYFMHVLRLLED